jgi:hypothetical protein
LAFLEAIFLSSANVAAKKWHELCLASILKRAMMIAFTISERFSRLLENYSNFTRQHRNMRACHVNLFIVFNFHMFNTLLPFWTTDDAKNGENWVTNLQKIGCMMIPGGRARYGKFRFHNNVKNSFNIKVFPLLGTFSLEEIFMHIWVFSSNFPRSYISLTDQHCCNDRSAPMMPANRFKRQALNFNFSIGTRWDLHNHPLHAT